jgi:hypothetical protein
MAFTLGGTTLGTSALTATLPRHPPTVTVDEPDETVTTSTTTVEWTYASALSRPQIGYRIVLESGGDELFDSGLLAGADLDHDLSFVLSPLTAYRLWVGVNDGLDGAEDPYGENDSWGFIDFDTSSLAISYDPEQGVGTLYEIAINGVGYMLADHPDFPIQRETAHLQGERLVTSDTPFDENIDRYSYISHSDWTGGEGQLLLRRPQSDPSRYYYSEWINPFEPGEMSCVTTPTLQIASTYSGASTRDRLVVASGIAFLQTGNDELTGVATPGAAPSSGFDTGLAGNITDLASDSEYWYSTDGATIRRNNAASTGTEWSTVDVTEIAWIGDRLAGLDTAASPPNITTFANDGTEEVASGRFSHAGATLRGIAGGDGYLWYGVNNLAGGRVMAWQVDSDDASFVGLSLPHAERVDNLFFYLGNVFVAAQGQRRRIYRCAPTDGRLIPELIWEADADGDPYRTLFTGWDRFVAFSWYQMCRTDESGIGVLDLESGGIARWQCAGSAAREVGGVATWAGEPAFSLISAGADGGFYGLDDAPVAHAGFLETSVDDLASNVTKVMVEVALTTKPLNGTVAVSYSNNTNATFTAIGTMAGSGATSRIFTMEQQDKSFGLRLDLTPSGSTGPTVKLLQSKVFPLGLVDQILTYPVRCADRLNGLGGAELPESKPGLGMEQMRTLEGLVGEVVDFQDIDWHRSQTVRRCEIVATKVEKVDKTYDHNQGCSVTSGILLVTFRRPIA